LPGRDAADWRTVEETIDVREAESGLPDVFRRCI